MFILLLFWLLRELAYQIAEQFRALGKPLGLRDCIIVGGMGMAESVFCLNRMAFCVSAKIDCVSVSKRHGDSGFGAFQEATCCCGHTREISRSHSKFRHV